MDWIIKCRYFLQPLGRAGKLDRPGISRSIYTTEMFRISVNETTAFLGLAESVWIFRCSLKDLRWWGRQTKDEANSVGKLKQFLFFRSIGRWNRMERNIKYVLRNAINRFINFMLLKYRNVARDYVLYIFNTFFIIYFSVFH